MGTYIHLTVGNLKIDWGKNDGFTDHSALYQPNDLVRVPYQYVEEGSVYTDETGKRCWKLYTEWQEGLSSPLYKVNDRIRLLGHTLETARKEFEHTCTLEYEGLVWSFEEFLAALLKVDLTKLGENYGEVSSYDFGEFVKKDVMPNFELAEMHENWDRFSLHAGVVVENLSPYTILTLLSENPSARNLPVTWDFKDHEESGWASRSDYIKPLAPENKFLIVTEGSSDALILKHAFALLRPQIADFFHYVDMQEGYPFSGTGNVYRFVQGLISIAVQNKVIVLFDNDAEGVASFQRCSELNVPKNMKILKLPDLEEFNSFRTIGPSGEVLANINGKGAAIECYLDLGKDPIVRWSAYKEAINTYQGELVKKDHYKRAFLDIKKLDPCYDYSRLQMVLKEIIEASVAMQEAIEIAAYESLLEEEDSIELHELDTESASAN